MKTFAANDTHGRRTLAGMVAIVNNKREKTIKDSRGLARKNKNAYNDPYTFYHIVDGLLEIWPNEMVKARELATYLEDRPIEWNPITVGRVVADIQEALLTANGRNVITSRRWWDGTRFWVSAETEDRVALENLLDDLRFLCKEPTDHYSPLRRCASLTTFEVDWDTL